MNRIDRLHAILTHLQSKKRVTAQEMADRFNISLRTVYRDVKALDESGVPVIGEAGTGYSIMEGYRLPPVMFTREEASALLLGSKLTEQFADGIVKQHFETALFKIKAVLRGTDKEYVESLNDSIEILRRRTPASEEGPDQYFSQLQQAIVLRRVVDLHYRASGREATRRHVEPFGLIHYSSAWHLIAWCRLRNGYRDFRINRMLGVTVREELFEAEAHPSVQEYIKEVTSHYEIEEVVVCFEPRVVPFLGEQKYLYGFVSEEALEEGRVRMKFMTSSIHFISRWLLSWTDHVRIESPDPLKELMRELGGRIYTHYK